MSAVAPDVLAGGLGDAPPRRWPRVLLALLLVAGVALAAEQWERQRGRAALVDAALDAEQVVVSARASLAGLVAYSGGTLARSDLAASQRQALLSTFARDAQRFVPRMTARRDAVAAVRVLPWDDDLRAARQRYLERLDGWTSFVTATGDDPGSLLLERRHTREQRERAAAALRTAAGADADVGEVTELLSR